MRKIITCAISIALLTINLIYLSAFAQVSEIAENRGAAATWQALLRLRSTATVLHTTAHPDDEDAALLTWLARQAGVRTGLLTINRGEGGANLIGPEQYDALGLMRTEELLAAGRYYGLDAQFFTLMADFGFSKRLDETLDQWGKENVLREMVRVVRTYRPDIIVSRFHGQARDGHGNHQTAGLMSFEIFKAAADPKMFPEQLATGLKPWQVKKLYLSVRPNEPASLKIDVGEYSPLLGRSYRELAMEGYGMHRSQSVGLARPAPGPFYSSVRLAESAVPKIENEQSLFDGLDTSVASMAKLAPSAKLTGDLTKLQTLIEEAFNQFDARSPWKVAQQLTESAQIVRQAIGKAQGASEAEGKDQLLFLLNNKDREINNALNKALGLRLEALLEPDASAPSNPFFQPARETPASVVPGQTFRVSVRAVAPSQVKLAANWMELQAPRGWQVIGPTEQMFGGGQPMRIEFTITVPSDASYSRPYWSRVSELRDHAYQTNNPRFAGAPFAPPELIGVLRYSLGGQQFQMTQPVMTSFIVPGRGEQRRLLTVAPAINVAISPRVGVVPLGTANATTVAVSLASNIKSKAEGKLKLRLPEGWKSEPAEQPFSFSREAERNSYTFKITIPTVEPGADYKLQAVANYAGRDYVEGYQIITQRDLEPRPLYREAAVTLRGVDVKVAPNLNVGYVMGVGDEIPKALEQIGVKVTMLNTNDLATGRLDHFGAIIIGVRASAVRDDLKAYNQRLLDYVQRGGNLVWQYQTPEFDDVAYGPYPYKMGRNPEEVSEEDSKVTILDPAHPIFNWPNKITDRDFTGWVEERGSKWWASWDERYRPLLETNDRQQPPQNGGLIFTRYGKGTFVYAGYAFYRQLPAGVEGAYRLFANIISLAGSAKAQ